MNFGETVGRKGAQGGRKDWGMINSAFLTIRLVSSDTRGQSQRCSKWQPPPPLHQPWPHTHHPLPPLAADPVGDVVLAAAAAVVLAAAHAVAAAVSELGQQTHLDGLEHQPAQVSKH